MNYEINPYLQFAGECAQAFELYASAFGGTPAIMRMGDMPGVAPEEYSHLVMHANLNIGPNMLMGSDNLPGQEAPLVKGNNQSVCVSPETREEADRLFAILSQGGEVDQAMEEMFFGYFGTFTDRYGIRWMIIVLPEEHCGN